MITFSGKMEIGGSGIGTTAWHQVNPLNKENLLDVAYSPSYNRNVGYIPHQVVPSIDGPYIVQDVFFDAMCAMMMRDVDILLSWCNHCLFQIRSFPKAKTIVTLHSAHPMVTEKILKDEPAWQPRPYLTLKGSRELEECDYILTSSEWVVNSLKEFGLEHKAKIIPLGADLSMFSPAEKTDDVFRVIFVGSNWVQKGLHYLLRAWEQLDLLNSELIIAGIEKPQGDKLLEVVAPKAKNITWGWYSREALADAYRSSDVLVLPSLQDGFGLVVVEAMACGIPVITTTNTGASQHIFNGNNGFVIPPKNVNALKDHIYALYYDRGIARKMGKNALKMAEKFSWERSEKELVKWIKTLL